MDPQTIKLILNTNTKFYQLAKEEFVMTRQNNMQGWSRVGDYFNKHCNYKISVLDVGCGNGRFYSFLRSNVQSDFDYKGIDSNEYFINYATKKYGQGLFYNEDFIQSLLPSKPELFGAGVEEKSHPLNYTHICVLGVMHHIPSKDLRLEWLTKVSQLLAHGGILVLAFWHFSKEKAVAPPDNVNIHLEPEDYFLGWNKRPELKRYCHYFNDSEILEIEELLKINDVSVLEKFESDGKDNKSNKYIIFQKV